MLEREQLSARAQRCARFSIAALAGVQPQEAGLASGLISTAQQVGGAIGVAVASSVSLSHFNHELKAGVKFPEAFTSGSQWAFWVMVGVAVASFIATLTLIRRDLAETAPFSYVVRVLGGRPGQ